MTILDEISKSDQPATLIEEFKIKKFNKWNKYLQYFFLIINLVLLVIRLLSTGSWLATLSFLQIVILVIQIIVFRISFVKNKKHRDFLNEFNQKSAKEKEAIISKELAIQQREELVQITETEKKVQPKRKML